MPETLSAAGSRDLALVADCARCVGLCCVALAFVRSADFAVSKPAGEPCTNLEDDYRCRIHPALRDRGFKGCTVFDCRGAGQKVTEMFGSRSWRSDAEARASMFKVFPVVRQLHDMLWFLHSVSKRRETAPISEALDAMYREIDAITEDPADVLIGTDVEQVRQRVNEILRTASELVRASDAGKRARLPKKVRAGADLIGARLARLDLRGADLRGALLIAADLSGSDLRNADLIAADLRDANLAGADLSSAIYVTQMQINAANGDVHTKLPEGVDRPTHWK
jgi:hypothetical protein